MECIKVIYCCYYINSNFYGLWVQKQLRQGFIFKSMKSDFREAFLHLDLSHAVEVGDFDMGKLRDTTSVVYSSPSTFAAWEYVHNAFSILSAVEFVWHPSNFW